MRHVWCIGVLSVFAHTRPSFIMRRMTRDLLGCGFALITLARLGKRFDMTLWGIGVDAYESATHLAVSRLFALDRRASVFGIFGAMFGTVGFLGRLALSRGYQHPPPGSVVLSIAWQLSGMPLLFFARTSSHPTPFEEFQS